MKKLWSEKRSAKQRRRRVITRLEAQLKSGKKITVNALEEGILHVPLTEKDRTRIKNELEILKTRI